MKGWSGKLRALPGWGARICCPCWQRCFSPHYSDGFAKRCAHARRCRVMERMAYHQGECTWRAFLLQFFGAALAIIGDIQSVVKGPHIFLNCCIRQSARAASVATTAQRGAGAWSAAGRLQGIAASFNTRWPAWCSLSVVMMEYSVASFIR